MFLRKWAFSAAYTLFFVTVLSLCCSLLLSMLSLSLAEKKARARELDTSSQLLISARIYNPQGYFILRQKNQYIAAKALKDGRLIPTKTIFKASQDQIEQVFNRRVLKMAVGKDGALLKGKQLEPNALSVYLVFSNASDSSVDCYVLPIHGFGLWDKIAGFLAIESDGKTVRGISWYDQKETPGLGGVIADQIWQEQFYGKCIFQADEKGNINMSRSPIGIKVLKGTVKDLYGSSPSGFDAVDGISGATLTGNGVTNAYRSCLEPYRPFFERLSKGSSGRYENR